MKAAGFVDPVEIDREMTILGTLALYRAAAP